MAAGFYWSIFLMLAMMFGLIGSVIFMMVRAGRRTPVLPAAAILTPSAQ